MDNTVFARIQELQQAAFFKMTTNSGYARIVNAPYLGGPIASAFERPSRFVDPALELGRLGIHQVHHMIWGIDAVSDSLDLIAKIPEWTRNGAVNVRSMAGGRC